MPRPLVRPRPLTFLFAVLAALVLALTLTSAQAWAAGAPDSPAQTATSDDDASDDPAATDDAATTQEPPAAEQPGAALAPEDFEVEYMGPECWDSSYNVTVMALAESDGVRLALQEEMDGEWVTLRTERFYDDVAFIYSDNLDEGETATFRVVAYHRGAPAEQTVLHGPMTVTGVPYTDDCEDWDFPSLPEEQWTVVEAGCETITFTSRAEEDVAVIWFGIEDEDDWGAEESYVFLAPGQSHTAETTHGLVYWVSVTGLDETLEPIEDELSFAGDGEVEVQQDCAPDAPAEPGAPTEPGAPAQPGDEGHRVPGRVQTDGGASASTMALGLGLMILAGAALVRRAG